MVLLFFQLPTSSSHTGDDMEEEDDMEDGDLEDLDGEGLNEPDMDEEDLDGEDIDQEMDGDGENISSNKGGSIDDEFHDFCNEIYGKHGC